MNSVWGNGQSVGILPRPAMSMLAAVSLSIVALGAFGVANVQAQTRGIYTCVDAQGKRMTSDRPIPECIDREQKVLNPSGSVQGKIGPTLTAQERTQAEAKDRLVYEEQSKREEEKRRDRALLSRYPNRAAHDAERSEAINQIGVVKAAAANRIEELGRQNKSISIEMEFYKKDPSKAPPALRRQVDELVKSQAVQTRFIADQDNEIKRVNLRFDEELVRLKELWAKQQAGAAAVAAATTPGLPPAPSAPAVKK